MSVQTYKIGECEYCDEEIMADSVVKLVWTSAIFCSEECKDKWINQQQSYGI
jgi:hypothetical protein